MDNRPLTGKQKLFVNAYLGEARFNATEAARLAGYKGDSNTLAKSLQVSRTTLYNRLNSLVDSGEMIRNGNGYELNETR